MSNTARLTRAPSGRLLCCLAAAALVAFASASAKADPLLFTGSVTGAFNNGPAGTTASFGGLTFVGNDFTAVPDPYGRPFHAGQDFIVGYLTLSSPTSFSSTDRFYLQFTFDPGNGVSPNPFVVEGIFLGTSDSITIVFPNNTNTFTFFDGVYSGTGRFGVGFSGSLHPGQTVAIHGNIFFTEPVTPPIPTPEPATLTLLGAGLAGAALRARKGHKPSARV